MVIELLWGRSLRWRYQWKKLSQSLWHDSTSQYSGCYLRPKAKLLRRVWAECYPHGLAKKDLKIWNEDSAENTHILWMGKNHSLYSRPPVWLVWIQVLCLCLINNICNCLAESKPFKQKVSRSVSDTSPPPQRSMWVFYGHGLRMIILTLFTKYLPAAFGGLVGLCTGSSFLSAAELVYFFTLRCALPICRKKRQVRKRDH